MDRNTFTGFFLILVIVVAATYFIQPDKQAFKQEQKLQDSLELVRSGKAPAPKKVVAPPKTIDTAALNGNFPGALSGENRSVTLENEKIKVVIGSKGARISSVELKEFKTYDRKPLMLLEGNANRFGIDLVSTGAKLNTNDLYFSSESPDIKVAGQDSSSVTFRLTYSEGRFLEYIYSLKGTGYKVGLTLVSKGMSGVFSGSNSIALNWEAALYKKEKDLTAERNSSTAYFRKADGEVEHLKTNGDETKNVAEEGKVQWISFKQHFFSNVLIPKNGFSAGSVSVATPLDTVTVKSIKANMQLPLPQGDSSAVPMEFYFGPNKFSTLKDQGNELERQVELGYWPLKYINRFAVLPIFNMLNKFNWNYGLIILALTVILKLVLTPLTYKSYLSMAKMRVLKPEMDEIKAKVGDDNQALLQQEYLKLYKKAGVNPLGGCIPMLLQLPIVMAFFFFFPNLFELRQESFLWMNDLSTYDAFFNFGFKIPFLGSHLSLMCILMTISTLIYTYFNNQISGATGQMKYIGYISPVIFLGVLNSYPSGLNYYYFLANMLTFLQQFVIRQMVDDKKIHNRIQENKKKPQTAKKKSGFQQRMEEYMKQMPPVKKK